jgi:PAS domain S-box-containing protein
MTHQKDQYANAALQHLYQSLDQTIEEKTQDLHESEKQYRLLVETMNEGLAVMDENHSLTYINKKLGEMLGYSRDELIGYTLNHLFDTLNCNIITKQLAKHKAGDNKSFEIEWTKKEGQKLSTIVSPSTQFDADGNFKGHFIVVTDITERKQAEAAIEQLKRQNELILNSVGEGISGLDKNGLTIFVNPAACNMLGFQANELIGKYFHDIAHHTRLDGTAYPVEKCPTLRVLKNGMTYHINDEVFWRKDGTSFPIEYTSTPILDENSQMMGVVVTFQDITKRKQAEEALLKERASLAQRVGERTAELSRINAELVRAVRMKDEFLANMSHELRTPLNAILAGAEILQELVFGSMNDKQLRYAHAIESSGRHLLGLINDILDLSKIEAGKMELQVETVSVKEICQTSMEFIKGLALKKRLKVFTNFDGTVKVIQADPRRFKQILINLLNNAVKFTCEKQTIGLEVVSDREHEVVHFTVWDTGIGIAESDMKKLFQTFVQVDSRLSRRFEGTGLGLALVRRLVELHGGSVSVESKVGKGSRFTVSLPWREPGETVLETDDTDAVTTMPSTTHDRPAPLILLAEDHESNILWILDYLRTKGYRVVVARHGKEAIERAKEERPDVILMDIQMPIMDGLEATQHIRADTALASVPIIALTALAMPGDKERCIAAGVNEYLSKPVHLKGLVKLIEEQLK